MKLIPRHTFFLFLKVFFANKDTGFHRLCRFLLPVGTIFLFKVTLFRRLIYLTVFFAAGVVLRRQMLSSFLIRLAGFLGPNLWQSKHLPIFFVFFFFCTDWGRVSQWGALASSAAHLSSHIFSYIGAVDVECRFWYFLHRQQKWMKCLLQWVQIHFISLVVSWFWNWFCKPSFDTLWENLFRRFLIWVNNFGDVHCEPF